MTNDEIKRLMREKPAKQVDIANLLNLHPNKISLSLNGQRQWKVAEMDMLRAYLGGEAAKHSGDPVRAIPIIGEVPGGNWREAIERPLGHVQLPEAGLPANAFAFRIIGDSMDKLVPDGGTVVVDPDDKGLFPGKNYVIMNGEGEATFKQFKSDPARLEPCSSNPAHQTIVIGEGSFQIVGRVILAVMRM